MTGSGKVALKASYGRYAANGSGVNAAAGPVANSVNPAATLVSTYTRWDGRIPAYAGPGGPDQRDRPEP